jgi:histidinol-phosphatase (PHP family)
MKKLRIDLHNHTYLCNHASGTMQEYIQKAIEFGIDVFGFSCHAPMNFDPKYRMSFEDMIIYENEIFRLQEEFKDKIKILFAYEVDFLEGFIDDKVINKDVDYFIGSVHFIDKWGFDNPEFIGRYDDMDIDDIWQKYFDAISLMAKSGLFDIVGHLDLIKVFKFMPKKKISDIAYDTLKEANYPQNLLISIGATSYTTFGKENFLQKQDELYIYLYDSNFYSKNDIFYLAKNGITQIPHSSTLHQSIV